MTACVVDERGQVVGQWRVAQKRLHRPAVIDHHLFAHSDELIRAGAIEDRRNHELVVRDSQAAIFFRDGKAMAAFEPGRHGKSDMTAEIRLPERDRGGYGGPAPMSAPPASGSPMSGPPMGGGPSMGGGPPSMGGGGPGFFGGGPGQGWAQGTGPLAQLFTAEERTAFQEQMRNAATPEQRYALMEAHRAEMQKHDIEPIGCSSEPAHMTQQRICGAGTGDQVRHPA